MGTIHGAEPRPRAIFQGLDARDIEQLAPLVGFHVVATPEGHTEIDQREFDLLVTTERVSCARHLHVLALGSESISGLHAKDTSMSVTRTADVRASRLDVPDQVGQPIEGLIVRTVLPALAETRPRSRWKWVHTYGNYPITLADSGVVALLTSHADDEVLAFAASLNNHGDDGGLVVALPVVPTDVVPWLRWLMAKARGVTPDAFPERTDWHEDVHWAPPQLQAALTERARLTAEHQEYLVELERRTQVLDAGVTAEIASAESGPWRLLRKQGKEFENAVADALETLGFKVDRRDTPDGEPKLEDLRISDSTEPDWVALAECKGLTKGAQARAVRQITGRPVHAFNREHGRGPDALYYIVNHNIPLPPPDRPEPLESDPVTISVLAENGGAVIDSRALLRAQITAMTDPQAKPQLRAAMRASRGRWDGTVDATIIGMDDQHDG